MSKITIPQVPYFKTILPIANKEISYRPYLVREESFLLQAKEVGNEKEILDLLYDLIGNCTKGVIPSKTSILDLEWIFLKIRMKSVGESVEHDYRCLNEVDGKRCNGQIKTFVDLNQVKLKGEANPSVEINIGGSVYKISMTSPNLKGTPKTELEEIYNHVSTFSDPVNGLLSKEDFSLEEFEGFLSTLTNEQYQKIKDSLNNIASLYLKEEIVCPKCGAKTVKEYRSLIDFFI